MSALDIQVGGNHYKDLKIQPVEYIHANGLGYHEGNVIKYVTRWRTKNGLDDLKKARHYLDLLIEAEEQTAPPQKAQEQEIKSQTVRDILNAMAMREGNAHTAEFDGVRVIFVEEDTGRL